MFSLVHQGMSIYIASKWTYRNVLKEAIIPVSCGFSLAPQEKCTVLAAIHQHSGGEDKVAHQ